MTKISRLRDESEHATWPVATHAFHACAAHGNKDVVALHPKLFNPWRGWGCASAFRWVRSTKYVMVVWYIVIIYPLLLFLFRFLYYYYFFARVCPTRTMPKGVCGFKCLGMAAGHLTITNNLFSFRRLGLKQCGIDAN